MILNEAYPLANGVQVPKLGLGTWFIDDAEAAEAVREAVKLGYRLIDTAQAYGNERGVGEGVRTCGVRREELFVASKIAAELKTYEDAAKSIDETLERMGLGYLDQMIIHSPQPWSEFRVEKRYFEENKEVWRALEDARAAGKVKVIGVSNFLQDDLENLLGSCRVMPMVNQILLHITNTDSALVDFCKAQGIQVEAYSPIAHGEALKNPAIVKMAEKYGVSAAQLCIRYVLQLGAVALPKTADPAHMESNAGVDFAISEEDMETLKNTKRIAEMIQREIGGDIARMDTVVPYDGDYDEVVNQGQREIAEGYCPELKPLHIGWRDYDTIILGSPVWWYTFAPAMRSFLERADLTGKIVYPFATNGGWLGHALKDFEEACKGAIVKPGLDVQFDESMLRTSEKDIQAWINTIRR